MYGNRDRFPFPDIFMTDLRLGDESGIHFLEWLRGKEEFKQLPVMILSGAVSPTEVAAAKKLGVSRVLQKPGDPAILIRMIESLSREFCPADSEHVHPSTASAPRKPRRHHLQTSS